MGLWVLGSPVLVSAAALVGPHLPREGLEVLVLA